MKAIDPQTVANERLIAEVAFELGMSQAQVRSIVKVQGEYTARVMRMGGLEGVIWPLFGKIKVKIARLYNQTRSQSNSAIRKNTLRPE